MDATLRRQIVDLAIERLKATADDDESYSFLFRTKGSYSLFWKRWPDPDEFQENVQIMLDRWGPERVRAIEIGESTPTPDEINQWRRAEAQFHVEHATEWVEIAWIVPIWIGDIVQGWALFRIQDDEPVFEEVFDRDLEALEFLASVGEIETDIEGRVQS